MDNKKILIEEVQRIRSMMGLKESFIPKALLKEGPGDLWGLVKAFVEADDTARAAMISTIKNNPEQKRFFDNLVTKYKGVIDPSNTIRSIDDLADLTRKTQLADFAKRILDDVDIVKTIAKQGINFATDYAKLASLETAAVGSPGASALQGVKNADPLAGTVLTKIKNNQLDELDAADIELVWNEAADLLSRETDPTIKGFYQGIVDDLQKAYSHKLELDDIATQRSLLNPNLADDIGSELTLKDTDFEQLYNMSETEFKAEFDNTKSLINKNKTAPRSEESIAVINVAYQRGIISEDEMTDLLTQKNASTWKMYFNYGKTYKETLFSSDGVDKLKKSLDSEISLANRTYGNDKSKWPAETKSKIGIMQSIIDDNFDLFIQSKALVNPEYVNFTAKYPWFGLKNFSGKSLGQAYDYLFSNLNPFNARLTAKQRTQIWVSWGLRVVGVTGLGVLIDLLTGLGMVASFVGLETGITEAFLKDMLIEWSKNGDYNARPTEGKEFNACDSPLPWCGNGLGKDDFVIVDSSLNLFVSRLVLMDPQMAGKDAASFIYKLDPYRVGFNRDAKNIIKAGYYTDFVVALKTSYIDTLADDKKTIINTALDKYNVPQYAPGKTRLKVAPKKVIGTYTEDIKNFNAWCKTLGYTECVKTPQGKWEYKNTKGDYKETKFVDASTGWQDMK